jgi:dTMP kinase
MGKLIVFEGIDGSGKSTQFNMLAELLRHIGNEFVQVSFPRYSEPSSALIRMYLNGEFGSKPDDVNPYAAAAFFALDRFASYRIDWGNYYNLGGTVLTDRYTTSNAVHQASKLSSGGLREVFWDWLYYFEFNLLCIPKPDIVVFLDVPADLAAKQIEKRRLETKSGTDIHETDFEYLSRCSECAIEAAAHFGWHRIDCAPNGTMRSVESIHSQITALITSIVKKDD